MPVALALTRQVRRAAAKTRHFPQADHSTHFMNPIAHSLADAIPERLLAIYSPRPGVRAVAVGSGRRTVVKVRGKDRRSLALITLIQYQTDRILHPPARYDGAKVIKDDNFGFENRTEDFKRGHLHRRVVGILDFLEQFLKAAEVTGNALGQNELADNTDRQMGFAGARAPDKNQARSVDGILFNKVHGLGFAMSQVRERGIDPVIFERTSLVARRDPRIFEKPLGASAELTFTARYPLAVPGADTSPAAPLAYWTGLDALKQVDIR
jgi:hypothetical protein